jgi:L-fuconolactonase
MGRGMVSSMTVNAGPENGYMVVDAHTHVIAADRRRYPLQTEEENARTEWFLKRGVSTEDLLQEMDRVGVRGGVLVHPISAYGSDSRYIVDSLRHHGQRCSGVGTMAFGESRDIPASMAALVSDGLRGLRMFHPGVQDGLLHTPNGARATSGITIDAAIHISQTAAGLGVPVLVEVDASELTTVRSLCEAVRQAAFVLDHCASVSFDPGQPWWNARHLFDLASVANLYLKVSSRTFRTVGTDQAPGLLSSLSQAFGSDRLLWGSDFSASAGTYAELVGLGRHAVRELSEDDAQNVLSGTTCRLWPDLAHLTAP